VPDDWHDSARITIPSEQNEGALGLRLFHLLSTLGFLSEDRDGRLGSRPTQSTLRPSLNFGVPLQSTSEVARLGATRRRPVGEL
jgi:hypothetical protein